MNMELLLNSNPSGLYFDKVFENISELSDEDNINAVLPGRLVFCKENSAIYRRIKSNNSNSYELLSYFGGSSDESIPGLPKVTIDDNGKILRVVSGIWDKDDLPSDLPNIEGSEDERKVLGIINGEWDKISLGNFATVINITKKGNGGAPDTVSQKIANANTGYKLTDSDIPLKANTTTQIFDGWHYNTSEGDRANINDVIFTDTVLVEKWINKKHFTIIYFDSQENLFIEKIIDKYIDPSLSSYTITQSDLNFNNITGETSPISINKSNFAYKYTFKNWYNETLGGVISTSTTLTVSQDNQLFMFYADWTKEKAFYISYRIPYGGQSLPLRTIEVGYNDTNYVLTNNDLPSFTNYIPPTGDKWYQASGWKDSNNNIVTNGSSIAAANITLSANYIEKSTYTIKYDTNGKCTAPSNYRYNSVKDYSTTDTFSMDFPLVNLPTRPEGVSDDWVFDGWSYNGNTYTNGSGSIQITFENTKEVTFVAQWSTNNNKVCYYGALSEKAAPTATELNNLSSILLTNGNNDFTVSISNNNRQHVFFMYPVSLTNITQYFYDGTEYSSGGFSDELGQATYNDIVYNLYITRYTQSGSVKIRLKKGEE